MLKLRDSYKPVRNSMAEFVDLPADYVRQKELQRRDTSAENLYDIFNSDAELPECLTSMDLIFEKQLLHD